MKKEKINKDKVKKGDQVFYLDDFGFLETKLKSNLSINEKTRSTPFGIKKGQNLLKLNSPEFGSVFIPVSKIKKVMRFKK